ncbi:tetratricopeptide repeat protein [Roseovarius sp.]|jgi:Flp pilus assembly protein TadD|uniref:tetratricopeptide repeat protein n=1 Tax=Roseovarius sp. TaxID=1486281 RepID=UPI00261F97F0|nr:tetratricopeptide repeat protein [Roseovarius sp.]MDM8168590.1 tetratricopeptide repeat protein [Roseovarius sp.]
MIRARAVFLTCIALAACSEGVSRDNPFAPGIKSGAEAVDGMLVGHRLMDAGEYELAIDAYSRAALQQGMTAEVLSGIGTANLKLSRLHTAERLLRQALDKDERSPEIWNNLGVVLMERGEIAEAEQVFRRAYALDNGQSDSIRDNLRLALEKSEISEYTPEEEQDYKLVRRGTSDYLIRKIP